MPASRGVVGIRVGSDRRPCPACCFDWSDDVRLAGRLLNRRRLHGQKPRTISCSSATSRGAPGRSSSPAPFRTISQSLDISLAGSAGRGVDCRPFRCLPAAPGARHGGRTRAAVPLLSWAACSGPILEGALQRLVGAPPAFDEAWVVRALAGSPARLSCLEESGCRSARMSCGSRWERSARTGVRVLAAGVLCAAQTDSRTTGPRTLLPVQLGSRR